MPHFGVFTVIWGGAFANNAHTYEGLHASRASGLAFRRQGSSSKQRLRKRSRQCKRAEGRLQPHRLWNPLCKGASWGLPPPSLIVKIKGAPHEFLTELILDGWQISDYKYYSVEFTGKSVSCITEFSPCERLWACWFFSIFKFQKVEEARKHNSNAEPTAGEGWMGNWARAEMEKGGGNKGEGWNANSCNSPQAGRQAGRQAERLTGERRQQQHTSPKSVSSPTPVFIDDDVSAGILQGAHERSHLAINITTVV